MKLFYVCIAWMTGIALGSLILIPALTYLAAGILTDWSPPQASGLQPE
jgi:hypothetical protein